MSCGLWCVYIVSVGAQLPEGLDEEPRALVACPVQRDPHGVFLQQSRESLVHRQVFVAFHVEELRKQAAVKKCSFEKPADKGQMSTQIVHQEEEDRY